MDFIEELRWRGMIHDIMPGTEEQLKKEKTVAYIGIDPTADSLHIGHLVGIMMLKHFQVCGHKPIVVVGGATGMIGDPSMKSTERILLDEATLRHNQEAIKKQISRFLDFDSSAPNAALLLNNYDWLKNYSFLDFAREIGKHITVNYMMSKDSVKKRLSSESTEGMSFTEFTYQLLQGYDYYHLYREYGCKLQMGGSDQWGNITTGSELIRRKCAGTCFALTCPLITKADGGKFGKTEKGNVWLDPKRTTPYAFYQFWINTSDDDAERFIKIFTLLSREETEALVRQHREAPHLRLLQKRLAREITSMVHGRTAYEQAIETSEILFGKGTQEQLRSLDTESLLTFLEGVPQMEISAGLLPLPLCDLLAVHTSVFPSKGACRKMVQGGGLSLNKQKITCSDRSVGNADLLEGNYLIVQKGKKNYFIIKVV